jgi:plasmid replication initiation protein
MAMRQASRRDAQFDLFVPYLSDIPLRDQLDTMERPFFSLSKRKRLEPINYTSPDGKVVLKVMSVKEHGIATIWDADILIWAASVIIAEMNRGANDIDRTLAVHPYELLKFMKRDTSGSKYKELQGALSRLKGTIFSTNIRLDDFKRQGMGGWIEDWWIDEDAETGKIKGMKITLSNWIFRGITRTGGALQIHPDYFLLTGGFERWLYRVVRKHAGNQEHGWHCTIPTLYAKSGSEDRETKFKAAIKRIIANDVLPEFHLDWIEETEGGEARMFAIRREHLDPNHPAFRFRSTSRRRARAKPPVTTTE